MTEKELLIKCIEHYKYCIDNFREDFDYLIDHGVDDGLCFYIEEFLQEDKPSWIATDGYWYQVPDKDEEPYINKHCLQVRLDKMKRILSTFVDDDIVIFNPNQLKLF